MNAERLLAHYERIAEAPDAIPRLRRFILDLAVRGKLVPQNREDEPASELLRRIAAERSTSKKMATTSKSSAAAVGAPELFDLPTAWNWTDLQTVCTSITDGDHLPPPKAEHGIPFLVIGDVRSKVINYSSTRHVAREYYESLDSIRRPRVGDLLYTLVGSFGIPVQVVDDREFCVQRHIGILRPSSGIAVTFLAWVLESGFAFSQAEACATGIAQKTVPLSGLRRMVLPLPPLAEQHRIVAKVDELMALCDQLEKSRMAQEETRDRLTAASLARLNDPAPKTFLTDARFALDTLPSMTARSGQIKQLRRTILNLAVRGRLVPQDPNDEPAAEALRRVAVEFAHLGEHDEIHEPFPFIVSNGWQWIRLGNVVGGSDAGWSPKTESHPRFGNNWGVLKVSAVSWGEFRDWENKEVLAGTTPRLQAKVSKGDFLISRANTAELVARAVIVEEEPVNLMMSDKIVRLKLSANIDHRYVLIVNNDADFARQYYAEQASGVSPSMKNVSRDVILNLPLPLPPFPEQERIVARVDELMTLCDRLEASLAAGTTARGRLLDALLSEAIAPIDAPRLEAAE